MIVTINTNLSRSFLCKMNFIRKLVDDGYTKLEITDRLQVRPDEVGRQLDEWLAYLGGSNFEKPKNHLQFYLAR